MMGQSAQDVVEVGIGLNPQSIARNHEREQIGGLLPAGFLSYVQPIAPLTATGA